jgi:hypothetical protein
LLLKTYWLAEKSDRGRLADRPMVYGPTFMGELLQIYASQEKNWAKNSMLKFSR